MQYMDILPQQEYYGLQLADETLETCGFCIRSQTNVSPQQWCSQRCSSDMILLLLLLFHKFEHHICCHAVLNMGCGQNQQTMKVVPYSPSSSEQNNVLDEN